MDTQYTVQNFMTTVLVTVHQDLNIYQAIDRLLKHHISGTPVLDDNKNMVGILTEKDCLRIMANGSFYDMPSGPVSRYMTARVHSVKPEMDIFVVADLFLKHHFRRVPVLDGKKLVGQISRRDVLKAVQDTSNVKKTHKAEKEYLSEAMKGTLNR
jgi:CBS domain-containing protein